MPYITLYSNEDLEEPVGEIALSDAIIFDRMGQGQPVRIFGRNTGGTVLRDVTVGVEGDGARFVQLAAISEDGGPGVWADRGQPIVINEGQTVFADDTFAFWARGIFDLEDREGVYPFQFVTRAKSLGRQAS